jgi:hypothetical protein
MKIKLSDKATMFFVIGTKIHLSFQDPGPKEVDFNNLRTDQKQQILWAIQNGTILSDRKEDEVRKEVIAKSYAQTVADVKAAVEAPATVGEFESSREEELKHFLTSKYNDFKKNLKDYNIAELRVMLKLEKEGKSRKSNLDLIENAISKHQVEVAKSIKDDIRPMVNDPKKVISTGLKVDWSNIEDVVESDTEEVKINLGAKDEEWQQPVT